MAVLYDSNQSRHNPVADNIKKYKVTLNNTRVLIMTGTSTRNIHKQLDEMIFRGDSFSKREVVEIHED